VTPAQARAVAPFVEASHVGVVELGPGGPGGKTPYAFLVRAPIMAERPIEVDASGFATALLQESRILEYTTAGGWPNTWRRLPLQLPIEAYQGAKLVAIWPEPSTVLL
jgi:hypothetical protein